MEENFPSQKPFNVMRLKVFALLCKTYYYEKLADKDPEKILEVVRQYLELGKLIEKNEGLGDVFLEALELIGERKESPSESIEEVINQEIYDKAYRLLKRYIGYYNELAKSAESKKEVITNAARLNLAIPFLVELKHKIPIVNALLPLLKFQIALYYKRAQAFNMAANLFQSAYEDVKGSDPNLAFISILNASLCYRADGQEALSIETFVKLKPFLIPEPKVELDKLHQCKDQIREMLHLASDYLSEMLSYNYTASKGLVKDLKLIIRKLNLLLSKSSSIR
jgi:tetratricopeptide (TPR) repeat protein